MALPDQIYIVTSIQDGAVDNMASSLQQIRTAQKEFDRSLKKVDTIFELMALAPVLPDVPTPAELATKVSDVQSSVDTKLQEFDDLAGLAGSCAVGGMAAAFSVANDAFGFVGESLSLFGDLASMSDEVLDISGLYGNARELLGGLGLDSLMAAALGKLGCLSDSTMIDDTTAELQLIMSELGMDTNGQVTDESFQTKMSTDISFLGNKHGITDTAYLDSLSDSTGAFNVASANFAKQASDASKAATQALKDSIKDEITKTPSPPNIW